MDQIIGDVLKTAVGAVFGTWIGYRVWLRQISSSFNFSHRHCERCFRAT